MEGGTRLTDEAADHTVMIEITAPEGGEGGTVQGTDTPDQVANRENATANNAANSHPVAEDEETAGPCCHSGNCCMRTRQGLESSIFSFALGSLLFCGGIALIAVSSKLPSGDYFLIGPFMVAAGVILLIRGCINKLAKKQERREMAEAAERQSRRQLTREQRSQRYEEQALSQENLIIPPDYFDVVPKPTVVSSSQSPVMVNAQSQAEFDMRGSVRRHMSTQADESPPHLQRLSSVQSQTSFPTMIDIAVDTSDLPTSPSSTSQAPPSYYLVTSPHSTNEDLATQAMDHTSSQNTITNQSTSTASYYLPDDDNG